MIAKALISLIHRLATAGIDKYDITGTAEGTVVEFNVLPTGNKITVLIEEHWRYPGIGCYFVNWSYDSGSFCCNEGTPFADRAIFDIGSCFGRLKYPKS